jgi:tRNA 2-thiocytidine biosynthesis protein TtcA
VPIHYELLAVHIDWREYPLSADDRGRLFDFLRQRDLPFLSVKASIHPPSFGRKFNCYLCSRNRKRIFFEIAEQKGFGAVALGHTMDDVVETTLLNLVFGGEFSTMMPVQTFFEGKMRIIRPMVEVPEREVADAAVRLGLPDIPTECPRKDDGRRLYIRKTIGELTRLNRRIRQNIYRSPWHIKTEYLPSSLQAVGTPP